MAAGSRLGPRRNLSPRDNAGWVTAFLVVAFLVPLNSAIGANPFFLRTHEVSGWLWIITQIALIAVVFVALWLVLALIRSKASARAFDITASVLAFVIAWFSAANGLGAEPHIASAFASWPTWVWWVAALIVAALLTQLARKVSAGTIVMVFLTVAALLPVILATLGSASSAVAAEATWTSSPGDRPSVLWVISDELNAHALVDSDGRVRDAFPTLQGLQDQASAYTNVYGLSNKTERAIPAMMSGVSDIGSQSDDLMEALGESTGLLGSLASDINITWSSGIFAPPPGASRCNTDQQSIAGRAGTFGADVAAILGNTALIEPLRGKFPPIEAKWRDFWSEVGQGWASTARQRLICAVDEGGPFFAIWHTLLTHNPYAYGRDGSPLVEGSVQDYGTIDIGLNRQGEVTTDAVYELQRRLYGNSVSNMDRRLASVIDVLKQSGRYDDTMIIFTADHGVALTEARRDGSGGEDERRVGADTEQMWGEIAHVPLIIKYPGQQEPEVIEAPRTSSQILPTVLDVLGAQLRAPWTMPPALDEDPEAITFTLRHNGDWTSYPYAGPGRFDDWSDSQTMLDPDYPYAVGIDPSLLGQAVPEGSRPVEVTMLAPRGYSADQVFRFTTNDRCQAETGLISVATADGTDRVVGSVAWEASTGPSTRGWAILPSRYGKKVTVWCTPGIN